MSSLSLQELQTPVAERGRVLIHTLSQECLGFVSALMGAGASASTVWPVANTACFVPLNIGRSILVNKLWVVAGAIGSDHVDMGLYKEDGTRLVSSGDTAAASVNTGQEFDITDTLLRGPGRYYIALACNGTTFAPFRANIASAPIINAMGMVQQATAFALPSPATFAINTSFTTIPLFGIAGRTTVM